MKRKNRKTFIIIDIDGTIINFKNIDNKIINEIYGKYKVALVIDKILWKINSLSIISNSIMKLKIRILFYSLISFVNPINAYRKYIYMYKKLSKMELNEEILDNINYLKTLVDYVIFTTNNLHAYCLRELLDTRIIQMHKRRFILRYYDVNVKYVVGDNLIDDILPAKKLNRKYTTLNRSKAKVVYIGNSSIVKKVPNIYIYDTFNDFVLSLKNNEKD